MSLRRKPCGSSVAAMCYWLAVSLVAWGALALVGLLWQPLQAFSGATLFLAMSIGCTANWLRNRTLHCVIAGPLFLVAGLLFLLSKTGALEINHRLVLAMALIGVDVALILEWTLTRRSSRA
jgi:hypothetical protein